jgi:hypothetical protein
MGEGFHVIVHFPQQQYHVGDLHQRRWYTNIEMG